ncbi:MAG: hypothetical protein ACREU2_12815 [Steroidobacteraceae bacterium]
MQRVTSWVLAVLAFSGTAFADDSTLLSCQLHSISASKDVQTIAIRFNQTQQRVWLGNHAVGASITDTEIYFDTATEDPAVTVHFNIKRLTGHITIAGKYGDVLMEGECKGATATVSKGALRSIR